MLGISSVFAGNAVFANKRQAEAAKYDLRNNYTQ